MPEKMLAWVIVTFADDMRLSLCFDGETGHYVIFKIFGRDRYKWCEYACFELAKDELSRFIGAEVLDGNGVESIWRYLKD